MEPDQQFGYAVPQPTALGKLRIMGEIVTKDADGDETHPMALLVTFSSAEEIRKAIKDGYCRFEF